MKRDITNLIFSKSLFTNLIFSFIVIILILSSFNIFSYKFYIDSIEEQIINNTNERLYNVFDNFEQYFDIIQKTIIRLYLEEDIQHILRKNTLSDYDVHTIYNIFTQYRNDFPYVPMFYLLTDKSDFVITPYATYNKHSFFNTFYNNPIYSKDFWMAETEGSFKHKLYSASDFIYYSNPGKASLYHLMPMAFKGSYNADHIVIALVDIVSLARDIDSSFMKDFYIVDNGNSIFQTGVSDTDLSSLSLDWGNGFKKIDEGYLFSLKSSSRGLTYYKLVPNDEIKSELRKTNLIFAIFIIISIIISFAISLYMVVKFNNPVKQIAEIIGSETNTYIKYSGVSLQDIQFHVQQMASRNIYYAEKISERDSALKSFIYQSKIKDIYSDINQMLDETMLASDYAIIYFKVHYRDLYFEEISEQSSMGTFYLKELIGLYINSYFNSSITFHTEKDQIVSIVNIDSENQNLEEIMTQIMEKLKTEEEYLFLTIVVSKIYKDVSNLSNAYYKTIDIAKYRQLIDDTQLMIEDQMNLGSRKFYFSLEQVSQFTNSLYNAHESEAVHLVENILEYNFKKEVNQFYINLLSLEIINHSMKVLMDLYYEVPDEFDIDLVYGQLDRCSTIEEYIKICIDFVSSVVGHIDTHEQKEDYIIDYVKEYVEEKYMTDIYLELLADNLNISKSYLSSYFKDKTGTNLNEYINNFRIQKALGLLENSAMQIQDIAKEVGISNANTFTRLFKKFTGQTPTEYRQSQI